MFGGVRARNIKGAITGDALATAAEDAEDSKRGYRITRSETYFTTKMSLGLYPRMSMLTMANTVIHKKHERSAAAVELEEYNSTRFVAHCQPAPLA